MRRRRHTVSLDDFKGHVIRDVLAASYGDGSDKHLNHVITICADGTVGNAYFEVMDKKKSKTFHTLASAVDRYNELP